MDDLAHRIKTARKQAGQSQAQLAARTKLTQQMISKLESGQSRSTSAIFSIAYALGVSAEWLWLGEENEHASPFGDNNANLAKAWENLSKKQQDEISRHIMNLSEQASAKDC